MRSRLVGCASEAADARNMGAQRQPPSRAELAVGLPALVKATRKLPPTVADEERQVAMDGAEPHMKPMWQGTHVRLSPAVMPADGTGNGNR